MPTRRTIAVIAVALASVATAACAGSGDSRSTERVVRPPLPRHVVKPPTSAELRWIGRLEAWYDEQSGFSTLADCGRTLSRDVPRAPSRRLRPFGATARRVCSLYERANRDERRALSTGDAELAAQASRRFREAGQAVNRLWRSLDVFRPNFNRDLPVLAGPIPKSRVDPELSRLARALVTRPVEIRCWSKADWSRLAMAMQVDAFAGPGGRRAHLYTRECNRILRFAQSPRLPSDEFERFELAVALNLFSHEVGHLGGNLDEALTE